jgi:hypothetical protein
MTRSHMTVSGLMNAGLPAFFCIRSSPSENISLTPKSQSLTVWWSSDMRTLSGLICARQENKRLSRVLPPRHLRPDTHVPVGDIIPMKVLKTEQQLAEVYASQLRIQRVCRIPSDLDLHDGPALHVLEHEVERV